MGLGRKSLVYYSEKLKLNVLFVYHEDITRSGLSSIGTYIVEIINGLNEKQQGVYFGPKPLNSYPASISYKSYSGKDNRLLNRIPETLRVMKELFRCRHYAQNSLVSVHRWEQAFPFFFEKKRGPVILTIHGSGEFTKIAYCHRPALLVFHWLMERCALCFCDQIILVSQDALNYSIRNFPRYKHKFMFIPTFVSEKSFYPMEKQKALNQLEIPSQKSAVFLYVGRLVPEKNISRMIELLHKYYSKLGRGELWIVGEGPEREPLERKAQELGIQERIYFWGKQNHKQLLNIYNIVDVLFLFSKFEGTSLSLLESLACGTPCLGTPVGDIPYIIQNDFNGFLIDLKSLDDMLEKLIKIMDNQESFRKNSINSVQSYHAGTVVPRIIEFYQKTYNDFYGMAG